jgi:hypothetical protein
VLKVFKNENELESEFLNPYSVDTSSFVYFRPVVKTYKTNVLQFARRQTITPDESNIVYSVREQ